MNIDKNIIKERLHDILKYYGASPGAKNKNWNCIPGRHKSRKSAENDLSINSDDVCCCHCGLNGDALKVIEIIDGITDFNEQLQRGCQILGIQPDDNISYPINKEIVKDTEEQQETVDNSFLIGQWHKNIDETDYFKNRGLTDKTINKYKLGYNPEDDTKHGKGYKYLMPVTNEFLIFRNNDTTGDMRTRNKGKVKLLNTRYITDDSKHVFIAEGYIDALSLEELGHKAISLNSAVNIKMLLELIELKRKSVSNKTFILIADNDKAGDELRIKAIEGFKKLGITLEICDVDKKYNDINEYLTADREGLKRAIELKIKDIETAIKEPLKSDDAKSEVKKGKEPLKIATVSDYMANGYVQELVANRDQQKIYTGFDKLDKELGGHLYAGLYCIGAISSLGKSSLIAQIADNIAKQEIDVLFFALEMGKCEMLSRSLTRNLVLSNPKANNNLNIGHIMYGKVANEKIMPVVNDYKANEGKYLYMIEGNFDVDVFTIRATVEAHVKNTGRNPVVIVDYLQVLKPIDARMTDKAATDTSVIELKRMSRDYNIPVVAISSFNRASYSTPVSYESFKESGSIEFTSDCVMGIQLKVVSELDHGGKDKDVTNKQIINGAKNKTPRELELVILKNRRGKAWSKIPYEFYSSFYYFEEGNEV